MRPHTALYAFFSLLLMQVGSAAHAQQLPDGTYRNGSQEGMSLQVSLVNNRVEVSVGTVGCLGLVEGWLGHNPSGQLFIVADDYEQSQCVIQIFPEGGRGFRMQQGPGCIYHHGAACSFEGTVWLQ